MTVTRRAALALAALSGLCLATTAAPAQEKPRDKASVAVLRFVSSGGLFLAVEKGYFREAGIDVELKFFEAAQPIAVAVVSGDADFGVTAFTGGFYNLAGKGALKVIAAQAKEAKGYEGNLVVASKAAYDAGLTGMEKLAGKSVGITQVGSSFHYQMGQIAAAKGFDLKSVQLKALQSLPNMMAAVKGGQVDAVIIAPHLAKSLVAAGDARAIGRVSDVAEYQFGGLFTNPKTIEGRRDFVQRFVSAYQRGAGDYAKSFLQKDASGAIAFGPEADRDASLIGKHVYPSDAAEQAVPKVKASAFYVDAEARIDVADIVQQVQWLKSEKLVDAGVDAQAVLDLSFVKGHLNAR